MSQTKYNCHSKGFSLLEVLVATAILVLLVGLLTSVVFTIMKVWTSGKANVNNQVRSRLVLGQVCNDLKDAVIRPDLGAFSDSAGALYPQGNALGTAPLSFYARRSGIGGKRSLSLISYRIVTSGTGSSLQRGDLASSWTQPGATFGQVGLPNLALLTDYRDILEDCLRFSVLFQNTDGTMTLSYDPETTKSAVVVLASLTEQSAPTLKAMGTYSDFQNRLIVPQSSNLQTITDEGGLRNVWQKALSSSSTSSAYPSKVLSGVLLLERTVTLSDSEKSQISP